VADRGPLNGHPELNGVIDRVVQLRGGSVHPRVGEAPVLHVQHLGAQVEVGVAVDDFGHQVQVEQTGVEVGALEAEQDLLGVVGEVGHVEIKVHLLDAQGLPNQVEPPPREAARVERHVLLVVRYLGHVRVVIELDVGFPHPTLSHDLLLGVAPHLGRPGQAVVLPLEGGLANEVYFATDGVDVEQGHHREEHVHVNLGLAQEGG